MVYGQSVYVIFIKDSVCFSRLKSLIRLISLYNLCVYKKNQNLFLSVITIFWGKIYIITVLNIPSVELNNKFSIFLIWLNTSLFGDSVWHKIFDDMRRNHRPRQNDSTSIYGMSVETNEGYIVLIKRYASLK